MKLIESIETFFTWCLIVILVVLMATGIVQLGRELINVYNNASYLPLEEKTLTSPLGPFLFILSGLILLNALGRRLTRHRLRPGIVIQAMMIATVGKVITTGVANMSTDTLLRVAAWMIFLLVSYVLLATTQRTDDA